MLKATDWKGVLFLDIETVPQKADFNELDERWKDLWEQKMRFTMEREEKLPGELYDRAGIYAEFGKIVCISIGYIEDKKYVEQSFFGHDEKKILEDFSQFLNSNDTFEKLCAHNGKEFDFPYIARRCIINGLAIPEMLDNSGKKPWEVGLLDTMELWKFGDYKSFTSLDLLTACFGFPSPKDELKGKDVWKAYWHENDLEKIRIYCEKDVRAIAKLFLKFKYPGKDFDF